MVEREIPENKRFLKVIRSIRVGFKFLVHYFGSESLHTTQFQLARQRIYLNSVSFLAQQGDVARPCEMSLVILLRISLSHCFGKSANIFIVLRICRAAGMSVMRAVTLYTELASGN